MLSYSVLDFSTTAAMPQRCRRSFHLHPRRTAAAATAAAAVRRLLCCGCGWYLLRLFLKIQKCMFCCGDDRGDRARPSCCAAIRRAGPSPPPPPTLLLLRLRCCCYCCAATAAAAVLSLVRMFQKCSVFVVAGDRCCCAWVLYTSQDDTFLCFGVFFVDFFIANSAK